MDPKDILTEFSHKACIEVVLKDFSTVMDIHSLDGKYSDIKVGISNQTNEENNSMCVDCENSAEKDISASNKSLASSEITNCLQDKLVTEGSKSCTPENDDKRKTTCYHFDNFIELGKSTKHFKTFLSGCKWSPDGTCLLTNCADFTIRLFDLPTYLYNKQYCNSNEEVLELEPSLKVTEGGQIYDYDWYPCMSSWSPESCCFLTTSSKAPVHLWDAYTGQIRATYRGFNRLDEPENALSVKFSLNGEKIFSGYKNEIKIFDLSIPGRDYLNIDTKHVAGQTGIISCIAENPSVPNMFAAGSYKKTIGLYLETGDSICLLEGQRSGITHIMWSHDGIYLYSGARKNPEIICWDMRNPGEVLCTMDRTVDTNQRIYFDVTPDGKYLISGSTSGKIIVWDLNQMTKMTGKQNSNYEFQAHIDCVNGLSVHKLLPIVATTSGQHHCPDITSDDDEEDRIFDVKNMITRIENSVKLWWIGPIENT